MGATNLYRRGVSQSNSDSYNPWSGQKCHIYSFKDAYSINQNYQRKKVNSSRMTCHLIPSLNLSDASSRLNPKS
jgi:hypothetical protein